MSPPAPLSRRTLLGAAARLAIAGAIVPAGANPSPRPPRFLLAWGRRGSELGEFIAPIGLAIDSRDQVYVTDFKNQRVQQFTIEGRFLAGFPVQAQPGGLAVDAAGLIYVAHWSLHKIAIYAPDGKPVREWGKQGNGDGEFRLPGGIAIARDGSVYVADQGNSRIQRFARDGRFLAKWGELGSGPGQFGAGKAPGSRFAGPQFLALDRAGNVYATDTATCRVQKFTPEGKFLLAWGRADNSPGGFGSSAPVSVAGPIALCVDRRDRVWVSATNHLVQQFGPDGRFRVAIGGKGSGPGEFSTPHSLALDRSGNLYVADVGNNRIQKFAPEG
jgi:sugar lactone lactonase YvrE